MSPGLDGTPSEEPVSELQSSVLDAPEFPDFEISELETAESEAVDVGTLDLEALDLASPHLPVLDKCNVADFEVPLPALPVSDPVEPLMSTDIKDLNLGSQNIIPLDPGSFPEPINLSEFPEPAVPEQWSHGAEVNMGPLSSTHTDETDLGAAEPQSAALETDNGNHTAYSDNIQTHHRYVFLASKVI